MVGKPGLSGIPLTPDDHVTLLWAIADGHWDEDIADLLGMPLYTVKWRLKQLYTWLGARNRAHAVALGYQQGWLRISGRSGRTQK